MNKNNQPLATKKAASTLARARFGPGMLLQHEDLEQMNVYTRELSRLMFGSLFGCGVICGLVVAAKPHCGKVTVTVGCGLALDCRGDPIHVPHPQTLVLDEDCDPDTPSPLWVVLCASVKCCAPRTAMCADDEDETASVCTRERDYFEIRIVRERPRCSCGCPEPGPNDRMQPGCDNECRCADPEHPCHKNHYAGHCCRGDCAEGDCAACDCDCVLLARLDRGADREQPVWTPDHRVRRFVRPVLMRDPQAWREERERYKDEDKADQDCQPQAGAAAHAQAREQAGDRAEPAPPPQDPAAAPAAPAPGPARAASEVLKRPRRRDHG